MKRRRSWIVFAMLVLAFAACGAAARSTTIYVKASEFHFALSASAAPRGRVVFVVKNVGLTAHNFRIDRKQTPLIAPGKTARLIVVFTKPGKYPYRCTVDEHALAGMRSIFTIR